MGKNDQEDPLSDPLEGLDEQARKNVELSITVARQAVQFSGMSELNGRINEVLQRAEEQRDRTFGDEHFVYAGHCIALREMLKSIGVWAEYQPPKKEGKSAAQYL